MSTSFLEGKKVILRPVTMSDVSLFVKWRNNPITRTYLLRRFPLTEIEEKHWIEKISASSPNPNNVVFVIEIKKTKAPIGTMGLHNINWIDRHATTGTAIGEAKHRGKGYSKDAKMVLLEYAFLTLGLHKIISHADARNIASINYSRSCGYVIEATLKDHIFRNGEWVDMVSLACFYQDWKKVKTSR